MLRHYFTFLLKKPNEINSNKIIGDLRMIRLLFNWFQRTFKLIILFDFYSSPTLEKGEVFSPL